MNPELNPLTMTPRGRSLRAKVEKLFTKYNSEGGDKL